MDESQKYTLFPISLILETVEILKEKKSVFRTYSELDLTAPLSSSRFRYLGEYTKSKAGNAGPFNMAAAILYMIAKRKGWKNVAALSQGILKSDKRPEIIIQHDADRYPIRTLEVMKTELKFGIKSSNFFFNEKSPNWDGDNEPYDIPINELKELEKCGFEIGYHQNAMELSGYDVSKAHEIIERDVKFFQKNFNLHSFVPHGGVLGPNGEENSHIPHEGFLSNLLWAYNGKCLLKDLMWSDGICEGVEGATDPREAAKNVENGMRAVFLFHPQYYGDKLRPDWFELPISNQVWWRNLWGI